MRTKGTLTILFKEQHPCFQVRKQINQPEAVNRKNSIKTWQNEWKETNTQTNVGENFEYHE